MNTPAPEAPASAEAAPDRQSSIVNGQSSPLPVDVTGTLNLGDRLRLGGYLLDWGPHRIRLTHGEDVALELLIGSDFVSFAVSTRGPCYPEIIRA